MAPVLLPGYTFRNTIIYYITVNPLLTPPPREGGLFMRSPFEGGLVATKGLFERGGGGLFNSEKNNGISSS